MVFKGIDFTVATGVRLDVQLCIKISEPFYSQMHGNRLVGETILRIINDGHHVITRNQEDITSIEYMRRFGLDNLSFTRDKPHQQVVFKKDLRFKQLVLENRKLDIWRYIIRFEFHVIVYNL